MKVRELIEELENFDDDMEVHISYTYGDHWRTIVAPDIYQVEEWKVKHSDYHGMPKVIQEDDKDYRGADVVVVISA